jgi:Type IV pilin PilA
LLGACAPCPLGLVSIGLGIAALVKISNNPGLGGKVLAIFGMVIPVAVLPIYAAIAIPNFIKFQARAKQAECKANLKSAFTAEQSFYAEKNAYSTNANEIGFSPERGNRYAYFLFDVGQMQDRSSARMDNGPGVTGISVDTLRYPDARPISYGDLPAVAGGAKAGVHGQCPQCSFVIVCAGNLDKDETLDVWSISSETRTSSTGESIPAGSPHCDVNDVNN